MTTEPSEAVGDPEAAGEAAAAFAVEEVNAVTGDLVDAIAGLIPQLSSSSPPPSAEELAVVVASPGTTLFVCRAASDGHPVVGTLTLVLYCIPTGVRAVIEDVVVDASARGGGAATALVKAALRAAYGGGATSVDLTSRPSREAANRLYVRLGFEKRETNVYRHQQR